ncbi:MAG: hypothetical protein D8M57_17060 [Candidatus Scalindua sp. AMX11]|nr:MAG: hypothetical protein DWQ00_12505 [Candidatus Scalindua sp.]NOG84059.1 hypothetical protein [Planctomycetota bacterium]RZV67438.1 MAG: hypothetical protein EX341_17025 [Candidatus Scalindua sp. SCAELEC01]TDE63680.1 MAG: hypothetical protein D8M57_17060 [Candidatus Scalindua sp. AMX11]GJQ60561.1 MAG: hypothetical protein SCALA701_33620 [Candidatus Scalindua sp.]
MVKRYFFITVFLFCVYGDLSFANTNITLNEIALELQQLKDAFQKMEENYEKKIENLETQLKGQQTDKDYSAKIESVERDYKTRIRSLEELLGTQKTEIEEDYDTKIRTLEELLAEERDRSQEEYMRITQRARADKRPVFYGTKGSLMNPDVSIIADTFYHFSDSKFGVGEFTDEDLYFREVELAIQGYIYPGVRAEFYPVWEVEEGKVEIEEAFANFLTLPFNSSLLVGRHRIRFGLVNPIHQHYRDYADVPLAVQNFLGVEGYIDDGINFSVMVPKISVPVELAFGIFDGDKSLAEEEEEEDGSRTFDLFESEPVEFQDHVFLAKVNTNLLILPNFDVSLGYHVLWDGNGSGNTAIHNGQFSLRYRFPNSYHKVLWQNELYVADVDDRDITSKGFYSLAKYNINRFLDAGFRYDWSELGSNDDAHQWALNPILTWHLTESSYVRAQYRYGELESSSSGNSSVNEGFIQFVWGLGPHSHGIKR